MKKVLESVSMGELTTVMTPKNWQENPEAVMAFLFAKIQQSGKSTEYFSILSENRFSYAEMMIITAEADEIADLRAAFNAMSAFKSWRTGTKRRLRQLERETLDLRRVCQYFLYSYIQSGGNHHELLPNFWQYIYAQE